MILDSTRPNRFEIDVDAISHNVAEIRRLVGPKTHLYAALKGNAYGFGLVRVARVVIDAGVSSIALADPLDAITLRSAGIATPILLYPATVFDEQTVRNFVEYRLTPTVVDLTSASLLSSHIDRDIDVFAKLDVGYERLGIPADVAPEALAQISGLPHLKVAGLYTHMHVPDGDPVEIRTYLEWQFSRFENVSRELELRTGLKPQLMAASSSVLRLSRTMALDAVDPGQSIFGLVPVGPELVHCDFRPAFVSLASRLIQVKDVLRTDFPALAPFSIDGVKRIGIIPMGLRDGLQHIHAGEVLVNGHRARFVGGLSLEHARIDLTDIRDAQAGDDVTIIGRQGSAEIAMTEVLAYREAIHSVNLIMEIRDSIPRVYVP